MKVFFASQSFYPLIGGVSTYLMNLAVGLKNHGHEVVEIHLRPPFEESEEEIKGIDVYRVPREPLDRELLEKYSYFKECVYKECHGEKKSFDKKAEEMPGFDAYHKVNEIIGKQLTELLSDHPAQVVHIHDFQLLLLYKFIPRGIPLVFTWHIPFSKKMSKNLSKFLIENLNGFDRVIFSNKEYVKAAVSMGLPREKARLIYPLTNTKLFKPLKEKKKFRKKYGIPINSRVILCVQRIDPKSGHEQLVKAMPFVLKKEPRARLVFVGGESMSSKISSDREKYVKKVKALIKKLGLARKVIFTGNIDYEKMPEIYAVADVVALTSKQEGFGLAVTEGMACGKPIIGTKTTGIKFQVEHGKNGFLVRVGDYRDTAKKIIKIITNKELAETMGKYSLKIVKKRFQTEKGVTQHIKLYNELLQEKSPKWKLKRLDLEEVKAIILDFDRTLTSKPGILNTKAFHKLKSLKKPLIIASGRNIDFIREFARKNHGFSAIVAENGAVIFFPRYKAIITIDTDKMREAREKIQKALPELSIGSVVVHAPTGMERDLKKAIGKMKGLKFVKNIDRVMLLPRRVDKGKGALLALHWLNINPEKTIIVGDGENDVDLFNIPGFRVAVANAVPKLKALADQVTVKESAKGVIEIVEALKA